MDGKSVGALGKCLQGGSPCARDLCPWPQGRRRKRSPSSARFAPSREDHSFAQAGCWPGDVHHAHCKVRQQDAVFSFALCVVENEERTNTSQQSEGAGMSAAAACVWRRGGPLRRSGREVASGIAPVYARHRPERTLLYRLVQEYSPALKAYGRHKRRGCRGMSSRRSRTTASAAGLTGVSYGRAAKLSCRAPGRRSRRFRWVKAHRTPILAPDPCLLIGVARPERPAKPVRSRTREVLPVPV